MKTIMEEQTQKAAEEANAAQDAPTGGGACDVAPQGSVARLSPVEALRVIRSVLADDALTAAQAKAVAAIICQADGATGCAWTAYRQLCRDYHLGSSQVSRAVELAGGRYIQAVRKGAHGAILYHVLTAPGCASAPATVAQEEEGATATGAQENASAPAVGAPNAPALPKTSASAPAVGAILTPDSKKQKDPPPPPRGASACLDSPQIENERQAVEHVERAMREAVGRGLSFSERWKVKREFSDGGGRELIGSIDAAVVVGAIKATPKDRTFGWGWLVKHAQRVQAQRAQAAKVAVGVDPAAEAMAAATAEDKKRLADQDAARMQHFGALDEARREEYRRRVRAGRFVPSREDQVERLAALAAWKEREAVSV